VVASGEVKVVMSGEEENEESRKNREKSSCIEMKILSKRYERIDRERCGEVERLSKEMSKYNWILSSSSYSSTCTA